ncbi:GNAT family N-acetyltransferase [bacterium]|nr:GNAT family N-acetyltransferase [bacterium]
MCLRTFQLQHEDYLVSTDERRLNPAELQPMLNQLYGEDGISRQQLLRQLEHSTILFGLYYIGKTQPWPLVGFCRVVSDLTRIAYLADVVIAEDWQGRGLGKLLMNSVASHPDLASVRVHCLETENAHGLYRRYGFRPIARPQYWMEKRRPGAPWK